MKGCFKSLSVHSLHVGYISGQQPPKGWNEGWYSFQTKASSTRTHTSQ